MIHALFYMESYNPKHIESKWQERWFSQDPSLFGASDNSDKKKFYALVEFPYPSGEGLHVGHPRSYVAMDIISRKRRMEGYNVLFPIGWDAFGLPAENYAIKTGTHPRVTTQKNTQRFKQQMQMLGLSFDWSREINTTDPSYYKWTQWIFSKLFEHGLAYKKAMAVNWCTSCNVGLANEEVVNGRCERCGGEVVQKEREQWMLKITSYAQRLLDDLNDVDYPARVKKQQEDWIGRSEGARITFEIKNPKSQGSSVEVFTTRPDTLFGATYVVCAPEHPVLKEIWDGITNREEVEMYQETTKKKTDLERQEEAREKTGIKLEGVSAINPATQEEIPIFIADYVLPHYGTGAIMAVPAHDTRDFAFAKKFNLPIIPVIKTDTADELDVYEGEGTLINSGKFNDMTSEGARDAIVKFVKGTKEVQYKLRDWVFSRQRYWGEPIPLVFCEHCASKIKNSKSKTKDSEFSLGELENPGWISVPEEQLPIELPELEEFKTGKNGDSPLADVRDWVITTCPRCGGEARRETDTMPQWAGSSWYYLRYTDPHNNEALASKDALKYWAPVDWYNGGMEHTTLHLLYSRFWHKFLFDIGVVPTKEPYAKRTSQGLILGEGGEKMSKSRGNVVNPDDIVKEFGADTFRMYEMFIGPFEDAAPWSSESIVGIERFLKRVWGMQERIGKEVETPSELYGLLHRTIEKISHDIELMRFNTAVSALMIFLNEIEKHERISKNIFESFLLLLSPFAPHITEELWERMGYNESISLEPWPQADEKYLVKEKVTIAVQFDGKTRGTVEVMSGASQQEVEETVQKHNSLKKHFQKSIARVVFVPDKIINFIHS